MIPRLAKRIMRFIANKSKEITNKRGRITIECEDVCEITNKEFEEEFGVGIKEDERCKIINLRLSIFVKIKEDL